MTPQMLTLTAAIVGPIIGILGAMWFNLGKKIDAMNLRQLEHERDNAGTFADLEARVKHLEKAGEH